MIAPSSKRKGGHYGLSSSSGKTRGGIGFVLKAGNGEIIRHVGNLQGRRTLSRTASKASQQRPRCRASWKRDLPQLNGRTKPGACRAGHGDPPGPEARAAYCRPCHLPGGFPRPRAVRMRVLWRAVLNRLASEERQKQVSEGEGWGSPQPGNVSTQVNTMRWASPPLHRAQVFSAPTPMMAVVLVCVVDTIRQAGERGQADAKQAERHGEASCSYIFTMFMPTDP